MRKLIAGFGALLSLAAVVCGLALFGWLIRHADQAVHSPRIPPASVSVFLAAASLVIGVFWATWAYGYLLFIGRGSPAEAFGIALLPTRQLVRTGPYAYTRNPMVFGGLWLALAVAFYQRSLIGFIAVVVLAVIAVFYLKAFEEPGLERRFGEAYQSYRRHVPLLIPHWHAIVTGEPDES